MLSDSELLIVSEILVKIIQDNIKKRTKIIKNEINQSLEKDYTQLNTDIVQNKVDENNIEEEINPLALRECMLIKKRRGRPRLLKPLIHVDI